MQSSIDYELKVEFRFPFSILDLISVICHCLEIAQWSWSIDSGLPLANWYGTGSGSDLAPSEAVAYKAPGRYRSLYRTVLRIRQRYLRLAAGDIKYQI
jgi:hypothetical protein